MYAKLTVTILATLLLSACQSSKVYDNKDIVKVGNVSWAKSGTASLNNDDIDANKSRVVFIRPGTNMTDQSSANIALNGRYLVSLQANHYTQSIVCSGEAVISVLPTGEKSNDLKALPLQVNFESKQTYFYLVDVDKSTQQPVITALSATQAQPLLADKALQTHQISRVVNNCPVQTPIDTQTTSANTTVAPAIQVTEVPTLRLNILFDNDQSIIKTQYQSEISRAAKFLANYPGVDVIIEGHTDANGSDTYNHALSQRRAESVKNALISQYAIDATRIRAIGYGESQPIADNTTVAGRQENRRVMIVISSQAK